MFKLYFLIIFSLFFNLIIPNVFADKKEVKIESNSIKKLNWESGVLNLKKELHWKTVDQDEFYIDLIKNKNISRKNNIFR